MMYNRLRCDYVAASGTHDVYESLKPTIQCDFNALQPDSRSRVATAIYYNIYPPGNGVYCFFVLSFIFFPLFLQTPCSRPIRCARRSSVNYYYVIIMLLGFIYQMGYIDVIEGDSWVILLLKNPESNTIFLSFYL